MRVTITIDDIIVEVDDESSQPTLDGIESVLKRSMNAAIYLYEQIIESNPTSVVSDDNLG